MKDNLKRDWNEIVAFYLSDEQFLARIQAVLYQSITTTPFNKYPKTLSQEEQFLYKRIQKWYTKEEEEELLKKLLIFNTPHTVNGIPLTGLPKFSADLIVNFMSNEAYRQVLTKAASSHVAKS